MILAFENSVINITKESFLIKVFLVVTSAKKINLKFCNKGTFFSLAKMLFAAFVRNASQMSTTKEKKASLIKAAKVEED